MMAEKAKAVVKRLFLEEQWSPEQIAKRLKAEGNAIHVSYSSIYRAIYARMLDEKKLSHGERGVVRKLRHHGKTRHRKGTEETRGKEFSRHSEITEAMKGLPFYFPKPHAPWERGTNENTNGLIREYCPKSVDLETFDESHFTTFTAKLNRRPRKCLGWKSPYEVFFDVALHLT